MEDDALKSGDTIADTGYRWTVRLMYGGLLAAELYMIYDAYFKDRPKMVEFRGKVAARRREIAGRLSGCEGCAKRKEWLRAKAHMLWEANDILAEAAPAPAQTEEAGE